MYPGGCGEELNWKKPTTRGWKTTRDGYKNTEGLGLFLRSNTNKNGVSMTDQTSNKKKKSL